MNIPIKIKNATWYTISLELDNQTSRHAKFLFYIFSSDTESKYFNKLSGDFLLYLDLQFQSLSLQRSLIAQLAFR